MKHVAIVGGGIIGRCIARVASESHRVTLIDAEPADHRGCSWGNSGYLVPSHFSPLASPGMLLAGLRMLPHRDSPFGIHQPMRGEMLSWLLRFARHCTKRHVAATHQLILDLNLRSQRLYREWAQGWPDAKISEAGLLLGCERWDTLDHETESVKVAKNLGLEAEVLSDHETQERFGQRVSSVGGVFFKCDSHLNPGDVLAALDADLAARGVTRLQSRVTRLDEIDADQIVIAAGAESSALTRSFGLKMPLIGGKGYSLIVPVEEPPTTPLIMVEGRTAITPMAGAVRIAGTMELGAEAAGINPARWEGVLSTARRTLPDLAPQIIAFAESDAGKERVWSGLRPCSPDGLPYIGRVRTDPRVIIATGHAMMGMSLGPITGHLVGQLLRDETTDLSLIPLDPHRFS
ncbi:MAG: FAD-binding oxidoreductase [Chthonomonas sp.]|nr:FAD-binding oxidoreductase [Chthonomonas sp.]